MTPVIFMTSAADRWPVTPFKTLLPVLTVGSGPHARNVFAVPPEFRDAALARGWLVAADLSATIAQGLVTAALVAHEGDKRYDLAREQLFIWEDGAWRDSVTGLAA